MPGVRRPEPRGGWPRKSKRSLRACRTEVFASLMVSPSLGITACVHVSASAARPRLAARQSRGRGSPLGQRAPWPPRTRSYAAKHRSSARWNAVAEGADRPCGADMPATMERAGAFLSSSRRSPTARANARSDADMPANGSRPILAAHPIAGLPGAGRSARQHRRANDRHATRCADQCAPTPNCDHRCLGRPPGGYPG